MFTRLTHKRFSDEIVEQIMGLIKGGTLKPGDTLPSERQMTVMLGVSRPPLREALKTLETMGYVEIFQRRKIVVKAFTDSSFYSPLAKAIEDDNRMALQLLQVRMIMESWAAATASQVATDEEIETLESLYRQVEEDYDRDLLGVDSDVKLHLTIYQCTHNTILAHLASTLFELLRQAQTVTRRTIFEDRQNKKRLLEQHRAIVLAIKERNPRKARAAVLTPPHLRPEAIQATHFIARVAYPGLGHASAKGGGSPGPLASGRFRAVPIHGQMVQRQGPVVGRRAPESFDIGCGQLSLDLHGISRHEPV